MTTMELVVVISGLFLGYWMVSLLMKPKVRPDLTDTGIEEKDTPALAPWHVVLEVSADATPEEIRAAYRVQMSLYHPDKVESLGAELKDLAARRSKEIGDAYRAGMHLHGIDA